MAPTRVARLSLALTVAWIAISVVACHGRGALTQDSTSGPARVPTSSAEPSAAPAARSNQHRRDLSVDERRGGHTLARHVGKTDDELRARLARERRISAASTYPDRDTAERVVGSALQAQSARLDAWLAREGRRPNLVIDYDGSPRVSIGRSIRRGSRNAEPCRSALVVLRWDEATGEYFVLTSYPEARR